MLFGIGGPHEKATNFPAILESSSSIFYGIPVVSLDVSQLRKSVGGDEMSAFQDILVANQFVTVVALQGVYTTPVTSS